jgi:hypothetical protein
LKARQNIRQKARLKVEQGRAADLPVGGTGRVGVVRDMLKRRKSGAK